MEKVLKTFSLSVWLTKGLLLLLSTPVFWCAGSGPYRFVFRETHTYRSLSHCFYNVWAVFVGLSVPQLPTTSNLRVFFFCRCATVSLLGLCSRHSLFLILWNRYTLYLFTAWSRTLLEKLTGSQPVNKFPTFYGTRRFITTITSARQLPLSRASSIQSIPSHPTS